MKAALTGALVALLVCTCISVASSSSSPASPGWYEYASADRVAFQAGQINRLKQSVKDLQADVRCLSTWIPVTTMEDVDGSTHVYVQPDPGGDYARVVVRDPSCS